VDKKNPDEFDGGRFTRGVAPCNATHFIKQGTPYFRPLLALTYNLIINSDHPSGDMLFWPPLLTPYQTSLVSGIINNSSAHFSE